MVEAEQKVLSDIRKMIMREHANATLDYDRLFVGQDDVDQSIISVNAKPSS